MASIHRSTTASCRSWESAGGVTGCGVADSVVGCCTGGSAGCGCTPGCWAGCGAGG